MVLCRGRAPRRARRDGARGRRDRATQGPRNRLRGDNSNNSVRPDGRPISALVSRLTAPLWLRLLRAQVSLTLTAPQVHSQNRVPARYVTRSTATCAKARALTRPLPAVLCTPQNNNEALNAAIDDYTVRWDILWYAAPAFVRSRGRAPKPRSHCPCAARLSGGPQLASRHDLARASTSCAHERHHGARRTQHAPLAPCSRALPPARPPAPPGLGCCCYCCAFNRRPIHSNDGRQLAG